MFMIQLKSDCVFTWQTRTADSRSPRAGHRGGSSFFPRGGGLTQRRCGASSTSRVAASRFFLLFWTPISDVFLASTNAMETIVHEPRSGEPIFLLLWTPVSDVFLASTNAMETIVHEPRSGEPIFFAILNPPGVSDVFLASTNAMETIVHEPRSGEPIFLLFWTPVSDVFLASTNAMETIVHEPRSGEPISFAILNPRKWCFPGIY